jgi:hypothetical protein
MRQTEEDKAQGYCLTLGIEVIEHKSRILCHVSGENFSHHNRLDGKANVLSSVKAGEYWQDRRPGESQKARTAIISKRMDDCARERAKARKGPLGGL